MNGHDTSWRPGATGFGVAFKHCGQFTQRRSRFAGSRRMFEPDGA
jgi:hypothetical protein